MGLPIGNRYTTTIKGEASKLVACEDCGCKFLYTMTREGLGSRDSYLWLRNKKASDEAANDARWDLQQKLSEEIEPAACPRCGVYQSEMVPEMRKRHLFGATLGAYVLLLASLVLALVRLPLFSVAAVIAAGGLWAGRLVALRRFDPNADAKSRAGRPEPHVSELSEEEYRELKVASGG
jgi:DNA-directed RNA polymerase subunit RPC12/RpoP